MAVALHFFNLESYSFDVCPYALDVKGKGTRNLSRWRYEIESRLERTFAIPSFIWPMYL